MTWSNVTDLEPGDVISILGVDHVFYDDVMRTGGSIAWNDLGCNPHLVVDGNFGPRTQEAVQRFQADNGLTADGIVGNKTWRQLVGV